MKTANRFAYLFGSIVLVVATFALTASAFQDSDARDTKTQWEHLALPHQGAGLGNDLAKRVNRLGNEGWQLVCVTAVSKEGTTEKTIYYFKRAK